MLSNQINDLKNIQYELHKINTLYGNNEELLLKLEEEIKGRLYSLSYPKSLYELIKTEDIVKRLNELHIEKKEFNDKVCVLRVRENELRDKIILENFNDEEFHIKMYVACKMNLCKISDSESDISDDSDDSDLIK